MKDDQKGIISFALGKAYDDLKDSEEAIKFLSLGNKMITKKEIQILLKKLIL